MLWRARILIGRAQRKHRLLINCAADDSGPRAQLSESPEKPMGIDRSRQQYSTPAQPSDHVPPEATIRGGALLRLLFNGSLGTEKPCR